VDGASLTLLTDEHLTQRLGMKLGPAVRLRAAVLKLIGAGAGAGGDGGDPCCPHCDHCQQRQKAQPPPKLGEEEKDFPSS